MDKLNKKRIILDVTEYVHDRVKTHAKSYGIFMRTFILRCIQREFDRIEKLEKGPDLKSNP